MVRVSQRHPAPSVSPPLRGGVRLTFRQRTLAERWANGGRPAFTLIEVTAVLVLMAVLAGAAVVALAGPRGRAVSADAVAQVAFADGQVRRAAVAADRPQALVIDLTAGRLSRAAAAAADAAAVTLVDLPRGVRVARVLLGADVIDFGQVRVPVSAGGVSRSYAVELSTPAGPRWLVVAGLTGQASPAADGAEVDEVLEPTHPPTGP
jgi:prepilin-type N-terminal cleavage/methylation domain-containing protein